MTNYEDHLNHLIDLSNNYDVADIDRAAIAFAIDLMQAAAPKDAEAERQECQRIAEEWLTYQRIAHPESASADALGDLLEEKRAAARADGAEELAALHAEVRRLREDMDHASEVLTGDILRLDVKLTNLRTAARRLAQHFQGTGVVSVAEGKVFVAAIEASR